MKVSARNAVSGKIVDLKKGSTTAHVVIEANGLKVMASITNEAVDDLNLKVGDQATAIIKASDIVLVVS